MGYEFTNDTDVVVEPIEKLTFNADAVLMVRDMDGNWKEKKVKVTSVEQLKMLVGKGYVVEQINVDKYHKIYYSLAELEKYGKITAHYRTDEEFHMMSAPILLVLCDDVKPINITSDALTKMKEMINLY